MTRPPAASPRSDPFRTVDVAPTEPRGGPCRRARRRTAGAVAVVLALLASLAAAVGPPAPGVGFPGPQAAAAQQVPAEAPDFASEVYGDPWDFNSAVDTSGMTVVHQLQWGTPEDPRPTTFPTYRFPTPTGGDLVVPTRPQTQLYLLRDWGTGALATGRDGPATPLDADRYRWVSFEVTADRAVHGAVFWRTCAREAASCTGARPFAIPAGRSLVTVPVHRGPQLGGSAAWAGMVRQLIITPNADVANATLRFHWIRVHAGGDSVGTSWVPGPPEPVRADWPAVRPRPRPVVVDPDLAGGQDYATTVRGDPWDMAQMSDVAQWANTSLRIDGGNLRGESAGRYNDPVVVLAAPGQINTRRWHRLSIQTTYSGGFGLQDEPGGGMVGRFIWQNPNLPGIHQESNDIVVMPGSQRIVLDLHTDPPSAVNDDEIPHRLGWGGFSSMLVHTPRWDPHEDPGHRVWWLEDVRLARNDLADPHFTIRFRDAAHQPGTTARLSLVDGPGARGGIALHAGTLPVTADGNTFPLDARTLPRQGTYHVRLELTGPTGIVAEAWSTGPVETGTPVEFVDVDPRGPFMGDVTWAVKEGIAAGYDPDTFGSTAPVSRQAMAAFLQRLLAPGTPPACSDAPFADVAHDHRFCRQIRWLVDRGIAQGYADGGFHPAAPVSRQAMAAFLHRATVGGAPPACARKPFPDVPVTSPFCGHITWLAGAGIATGYPDGGFHPAAPVSRQAMAAFLHRSAGQG